MTESVFTPLVLPRVGEAQPDPRIAGERARARGYAEGFAQGRRDARAELERERRAADQEAAAREALAAEEHRSAIAALEAARSRLDDEVARVTASDLLRLEELAVDLAETILGIEMSDAARSAAHAMRRAAAGTAPALWVRVELNERDLRADGPVSPSEGVQVVASAQVDPGGAIVHLAHGSVDSRIDAALARAREALVAGEAAT